MTIPEPPNGSHVVVDYNNERIPHPGLYWRDDAKAATRPVEQGHRWFTGEGFSHPRTWADISANRTVFLARPEPMTPLDQPGDPAKVAVRLVVGEVISDEIFDRAEFEAAKTRDVGGLSDLIDVYVSDMDGESLVVEADGTVTKPVW